MSGDSDSPVTRTETVTTDEHGNVTKKVTNVASGTILGTLVQADTINGGLVLGG